MLRGILGNALTFFTMVRKILHENDRTSVDPSLSGNRTLVSGWGSYPRGSGVWLGVLLQGSGRCVSYESLLCGLVGGLMGGLT